MTGPPAGRPGAGFGGAIAGVVIGGFGWLVISGLVIGDPLVWIPPIVIGAALWWGAMRAFAARPERWGTLLGIAMLCVLLIAALYLEPVFRRIPQRVAGMPTGRSMPILQLKVTLGLLALLAVTLVGRDLFKEK